MPNPEIKKTYGLIANPQNNKLIAELTQKGEEVLLFPAIAANAVKLPENALGFIKDPASFDWMVFTDIFAADYFIEAMREFETDFFELDNLTVCAFGESVSDRLRFVQIHADVIPPKIDDETVFSEISQFTGGDLQDLRFLVLREASAEFSLVEMLKRENAAVEELPIYKAEPGQSHENLRLKTLLKSGAVDEFVFSSAEDVLGLKFLFPGTNLPQILNDVQTSATDGNTFQTLSENGFRPQYFRNK